MGCFCFGPVLSSLTICLEISGTELKLIPSAKSDGMRSLARLDRQANNIARVKPTWRRVVSLQRSRLPILVYWQRRRGFRVASHLRPTADMSGRPICSSSEGRSGKKPSSTGHSATATIESILRFQYQRTVCWRS